MSGSLIWIILAISFVTVVIGGFVAVLNGGNEDSDFAVIYGEDAKEIAAHLGVELDADLISQANAHKVSGRLGDSQVTITKLGLAKYNPFLSMFSKAPRYSQGFWVCGYIGSKLDSLLLGGQVSSIELANDTKVYRGTDAELQFSEEQLAALNELVELKIPFKLQNNPGMNEFSVSLCKDPEGKEVEVLKRLLRVF